MATKKVGILTRIENALKSIGHPSMPSGGQVGGALLGSKPIIGPVKKAPVYGDANARKAILKQVETELNSQSNAATRKK